MVANLKQRRLSQYEIGEKHGELILKDTVYLSGHPDNIELVYVGG